MTQWFVTHPSVLTAAIALSLLWLAEATVPFFLHRRRRGSHGGRNVALGLMNGTLRALFFPAALVLVTGAAESRELGLLRMTALPAWAQAVLALVLLDLAGYGWHVACHQWRFLWRFHAVHHHDDSVDSTTAFRFHAGDVLIGSLVTLVAAGVLGLQVQHVLLYEAVLVPLSIFHHGNIRVPQRLDRVLRRVIVTPSIHWVHHSRWVAETDSNYAGIFSFWDRLFGTLRLRDDPAQIRMGLDGYRAADHATLRGCLMTPFAPIKSLPGRDTRARAVRLPAPVPRRPRGLADHPLWPGSPSELPPGAGPALGSIWIRTATRARIPMTVVAPWECAVP